MTVEEKIKNALRYINPKLEELSEGYVEFMDFDRDEGILTIRTYGGRLL